MMWKLCLTSLLTASVAGLRGRGLIDFGGPPHTNATVPQNLVAPQTATLSATETQKGTCGAFPGQQVVLVTVDKDFMPFFQNWLHFAGPYLTSSEQIVAFAEDGEVVPMLRRFLHEGARTPFKIAIPVNETAWDVSLAAVSDSRDIYKIGVQDSHPFNSKAYKEVVSRRPRQIRHFLEQNCSVLYADIDTAWLQNPFDAISRAGDYEMYVTEDSRPRERRKRKGLNSTYLCSCFLYMHPTSNVKGVLSRWEVLMQGKPGHNQWRFNTAFQEIRKRSPGFAVALPYEEFPPGGVPSANPAVLHANGITGEKSKRSYLQKRGAWSP